MMGISLISEINIASWVVIGGPIVIAFGIFFTKMARPLGLFAEFATEYDLLISGWICISIAIGCATQMVLASNLGIRFTAFLFTLVCLLWGYRELRKYWRTHRYETEAERNERKRSGQADDNDEFLKKLKNED